MCFSFFFNNTATTEIYTLSLHDALPIYYHAVLVDEGERVLFAGDHVLPRITSNVGLYPFSRDDPLGDFLDALRAVRSLPVDRKSTRLNSSHSQISYAVFCLKKKKRKNKK